MGGQLWSGKVRAPGDWEPDGMADGDGMPAAKGEQAGEKWEGGIAPGKTPAATQGRQMGAMTERTHSGLPPEYPPADFDGPHATARDRPPLRHCAGTSHF